MIVTRWAATVLAALFTTACLAAGDHTAITVYPNGAAVVADTRALTLEAGTRTVRLSGFPDTLRPQTLWVAGEGVSLISSGFRTDKSAKQALLRARVGQTVLLLRPDGSGGGIRRKATLVSAEGTPVVRIHGRIEWLGGASPWRIALQKMPESVALDGQLALTLDVAEEQHQLDLIYQMSGLKWSAAYVGRLDLDNQTLSLRALAALENRTGVAWDNVQLALVAGEVNRSNSRVRPVAMRMATAASVGVKATSTGFYYRYTLDQPVTLAPGQQLNVTLFAHIGDSGGCPVPHCRWLAARRGGSAAYPRRGPGAFRKSIGQAAAGRHRTCLRYQYTAHAPRRGPDREYADRRQCGHHAGAGIQCHGHASDRGYRARRQSACD